MQGEDPGSGHRQDDERSADSSCARACERKTQHSSAADAGSTHTLKQNNTNNISQGSYCTNIPRAFRPKLS